MFARVRFHYNFIFSKLVCVFRVQNYPYFTIVWCMTNNHGDNVSAAPPAPLDSGGADVLSSSRTRCRALKASRQGGHDAVSAFLEVACKEA